MADVLMQAVMYIPFVAGLFMYVVGLRSAQQGLGAFKRAEWFHAQAEESEKRAQAILDQAIECEKVTNRHRLAILDALRPHWSPSKPTREQKPS